MRRGQFHAWYWWQRPHPAPKWARLLRERKSVIYKRAWWEEESPTKSRQQQQQQQQQHIVQRQPRSTPPPRMYVICSYPKTARSVFWGVPTQSINVVFVRPTSSYCASRHTWRVPFWLKWGPQRRRGLGTRPRPLGAFRDTWDRASGRRVGARRNNVVETWHPSWLVHWVWRFLYSCRTKHARSRRKSKLFCCIVHGVIKRTRQHVNSRLWDAVGT